MIPLDASEERLAKEAAKELRLAKDALTRCVLIEISNRQGKPANSPRLQEDVEKEVGSQLRWLIPSIADDHAEEVFARPGYRDTNVSLRDIR